MGIRKARGWIDWRHRVLPAPALSLSLHYYYTIIFTIKLRHYYLLFLTLFSLIVLAITC